jgi:predicted outer membrane repeat protein
VRLTGTSSLIVNCLFSNNFSDEAGGAIYSDAVDSQIINCLFNSNFSDGAGGAIFTDAVGTQIINCTFAMNIANLNAAATGGGAIFALGGTTTVANCIAVDNVPDQFRVDAGTLDVTFSNIEGGWPGVGNIASDPQFVDPSAEDYHLADTSPCIDAASNPAVPRGITEDLDGHPRFVDDPATVDTGLGRAPIVDMGAYEFQPPFDPADLDEDGDVDGFDLALLLGAWGACPKRGDCAADLNDDGDVDGFDLAILLAAWS